MQKILAESGLCSRRKAEELIAEGRVKVNGHVAAVGQKVDPNRDHIQVDGEKLDLSQRETAVYYMLYKPRGYLTAMSDDRGRKCVAELVEDIPQRVFPVGRLDMNSEGLLLFTNDGDFANDMTHPSRQVPKTYRAEVKIVTEEPGRTVLLITITEGKNREIRRMCEAVGLEVARLKRLSIGPVKLGMLKPGTYRELSGDEVDALQRTARRGPAEQEVIGCFTFGRIRRKTIFPSLPGD